MAPLLNKLIVVQTLDPDLGFLVGSSNKRAAGVPGMYLCCISHRGGEEMMVPVLWLAWLLVLRQGSREEAPGSVLTMDLRQSLYKKVDL
jgi:hypothetical protein